MRSNISLCIHEYMSNRGEQLLGGKIQQMQSYDNEVASALLALCVEAQARQTTKCEELFRIGRVLLHVNIKSKQPQILVDGPLSLSLGWRNVGGNEDESKTPWLQEPSILSYIINM